MWHLAPKEDMFIELLKENIKLVNLGADIFLNLFDNYSDLEKQLAKINELENESEVITQRIIQKLESTYITPMDREDIYTLARRIRNIIGTIQATIDRLKIYRLGKPNQDILELVKLLKATVTSIEKTIEYMNDLRENYNNIVKTCEIVDVYEHEADDYYRNGLGRLFDEVKDTIEVIKWKEIFEHLEKAVDQCKDLADQVKEVAIKYV